MPPTSPHVDLISSCLDMEGPARCGAWWKEANYWECALERNICLNLLSVFCLIESKLHLFVYVCLCAIANIHMEIRGQLTEKLVFPFHSVCHGFKLKTVRLGSKHP